MKSIITSAFVIISIVIVSSCGMQKETPNYQLADGYYKSKAFNHSTTKVYVDIGEDSIYVYRLDKLGNMFYDDTSSKAKLIFPLNTSSELIKSRIFRQTSFDINFLAIPFKYRSSEKGFPPQFTTNLNGAIYLGHRNDIYQLNYRKTPLHRYQRQTTHYGFSFGLFTGLGGTAINQWVTENNILSEYDGVVWSKGIAGIIGINNFTIGLAIGMDDLLDSNKKFWIYQQKPWFGLAFGLNLN